MKSRVKKKEWIEWRRRRKKKDLIKEEEEEKEEFDRCTWAKLIFLSNHALLSFSLLFLFVSKWVVGFFFTLFLCLLGFLLLFSPFLVGFFLCFLGFSLLFSPYPSFYGFYVFMELESLKLKFHMDTFSTLVLPVHGTWVSKTRFATVNSSLRDLRC